MKPIEDRALVLRNRIRRLKATIENKQSELRSVTEALRSELDAWERGLGSDEK